MNRNRGRIIVLFQIIKRCECLLCHLVIGSTSLECVYEAMKLGSL